jgi:large subunit ribosomal protein L19
MNLIQTLEAEAIQQFAATKTIPEFRPGDTLRVGVRVVEGDRTPRPELRGRLHRPLQSRPGFQLHRPQDQLRRRRRARLPALQPEHRDDRVVRRGAVRRAKLYYLRGRTGKSARIAERRDTRVAKAAGRNQDGRSGAAPATENAEG